MCTVRNAAIVQNDFERMESLKRTPSFVQEAERDLKVFKADLGLTDDGLKSSPVLVRSAEPTSFSPNPIISGGADFSAHPALQVDSSIINRVQVSQASSDPNFYKNACGYSAETNHDLEVTEQSERNHIPSSDFPWPHSK